MWCKYYASEASNANNTISTRNASYASNASKASNESNVSNAKMKVMLVTLVRQVSQVIRESLAHLWVDFRVIGYMYDDFASPVLLRYLQNYPITFSFFLISLKRWRYFLKMSHRARASPSVFSLCCDHSDQFVLGPFWPNCPLQLRLKRSWNWRECAQGHSAAKNISREIFQQRL